MKIVDSYYGISELGFLEVADECTTVYFFNEELIALEQIAKGEITEYTHTYYITKIVMNGEYFEVTGDIWSDIHGFITNDTVRIPVSLLPHLLKYKNSIQSDKENWCK